MIPICCPVGFFNQAIGLFEITNSVRLDGSADYFSRAFTTSTTTSGSVWVKRCKLASVTPIFDGKIYFNASDQLVAFGLTSTAVFRDSTAWVHIFWNGSGVWVNGSSVSGSGSYSQSSTSNPRIGYNGTNYASVYVSDFALFDGSSVSLTGGASDSTTGSWRAARPNGSPYSFLDFANTADLGNDVSGNNNDWTLNSLGNTDAVSDTPTNNFATLSSLDMSSSVTLSNGNRTASVAAAAFHGVRATVPVPSTGLWVYAFTKVSGTTTIATLAPASAALTGSGYNNAGVIAWLNSGEIRLSGVDQGAVGASYSDGNECAIVFNADTAQALFYVNGVLKHTMSSVPVLERAPAGWLYSATMTFNFGGTAFGYSYGSAKTLCTTNLPATTGSTSGSFTGNANADGPFVWTGAPPATLTIDGNAVTFGTHADRTAGGFKIRTASSPYNDAATNNWTAIYSSPQKPFVGSNKVPGTAQGNP